MGEVLNYNEALTHAMDELASNPKTIFVGQSIRYPGQAMYKTFASVPIERRFEMPIAEDFQMGFCTGLALAGFLPVCIFTRWDFMLLAANQLVNHLDKIPLLSDMRPKVIIRVSVGSSYPLNGGPQHTQDHSDAFELMLKKVRVLRLKDAESVTRGYKDAMELPGPYIMVEYMSNYNV